MSVSIAVIGVAVSVQGRNSLEDILYLFCCGKGFLEAFATAQNLAKQSGDLAFYLSC